MTIYAHRLAKRAVRGQRYASQCNNFRTYRPPWRINLETKLLWHFLLKEVATPKCSGFLSTVQTKTLYNLFFSLVGNLVILLLDRAPWHPSLVLEHIWCQHLMLEAHKLFSRESVLSYRGVSVFPSFAANNPRARWDNINNTKRRCYDELDLSASSTLSTIVVITVRVTGLPVFRCHRGKRLRLLFSTTRHHDSRKEFRASSHFAVRTHLMNFQSDANRL